MRGAVSFADCLASTATWRHIMTLRCSPLTDIAQFVGSVRPVDSVRFDRPPIFRPEAMWSENASWSWSTFTSVRSISYAAPSKLCCFNSEV